MGNRRHNRDRNREFGGRSRHENDRDEPRFTGYGPSDFRGGPSSSGSDERYFGGSRQHGEGYGGGRTSLDMGDWRRDTSSWGSNYGSEYGSGSYGSDRPEYGRDRYSESRQDRRNYSSRGSYDRSDYDRGDDHTPRFRTGGMFGGGIGGYSGGGYQGYNPGGGVGYGGDRGGYDRDRYSSGRSSYTNYSDYPSSERVYRSDRDDYNYEERGWLDRAGDEVASWFGDEEAQRRRQMDERGDHRGRGPRNYSRSDDRIKEDVSDRLTDSSYLDASDIDIEVSSGEVVLTGTVESRFAKRMAEDIAEDVSGVKNVENRIRVNRDWNTNRSNFGTSGTSSTVGSTSSTSTSSDSNSFISDEPVTAKGKSAG